MTPYIPVRNRHPVGLLAALWPHGPRVGARGAVCTALAALPLMGCGGGGSTASNSSASADFIHWQGNSNGTVVLAANNENVQFDAATGDMVYKGTLYSNVAVSGGNLYLAGKLIGTVSIKTGTGNSNVAVMVCQSGNTVTLVPSGNTLTLDCGTGAGGTGGTTGTGGSGSTGGTGTTPVVLPTCAGGSGGGTNGLSFYNPSGLIAYSVGSSLAGTPVTSTLTWGVQYQSGASSGGYSGSVRARLWAVKSSYAGGSISGAVLGVFNPQFTGSGAYSANQVVVGGYSTTSVQSSAQETTPDVGGYCIVATLEEYSTSCSTSDHFCIADWIQFGQPAGFK